MIFSLAVFKISQRDDLSADPYCGLDLECGNLTHVRDTPSHYALFVCEVSLNLFQYFISCIDTISATM